MIRSVDVVDVKEVSDVFEVKGIDVMSKVIVEDESKIEVLKGNNV